MNYYWERQLEGKWQPPPGQDLAAMRRGFGRDVGDVPQMWELYSRFTGDGRVTPSLRAEHAALALFGLHQQGVSSSVHAPGRGVGTLAAIIRLSGRFSQEAVTQRFVRAASASTVTGVTHHLRGLIQEAKALSPVPALDYTRLVQELIGWGKSAQLSAIRRSWGMQFHSYTLKSESGDRA